MSSKGRTTRCVSDSEEDDESSQPAQPAPPAPPSTQQQQRIESSFRAPLQKRRRKDVPSKIPTASSLRQLPLTAAFGTPNGTKGCGLPSTRRVVDLFACIGGFSTGAAQAGHEVVLAVDCDDAALAIHEANHPKAVHKIMFLGPDTEQELVALIRSVVPDGAEWHLHGSPPCTKLSVARAMGQLGKAEIDRGEEEGSCLVDWYLDFVERVRPTSWSMEQVSCKPVRSTLQARMKAHKDLYDYEVVEFAKFGVPQTRTRLFAGCPQLVARIRFGSGMRVERVRTIRDAIADVPEGAAYVRGNWHRETKQDDVEEASNGEFIHEDAQRLARRLDEPAWTVLANDPLQWWDIRYARIRNLNIPESLAIQTFPTDYARAPDTKVNDFLRGIGNAVPSLFARKLMTVVAASP